MKSDLSKVKVGDSIWTIQEGWAEVKKVFTNDFETKNHAYYFNGKRLSNNQHPSAFLTNPFVDEEFIKEAYSEACPKWQSKLKEKFPEVFKSELEVNRWYKADSGGLWFIEKLLDNGSEISYGFGSTGNFYESSKRCKSLNYTLATESEVKEALINEAKKRGFKEGVSIDNSNLNYNDCGVGNIISKNVGFYYQKDNTLWIKSTSDYSANRCIFKNGTWATILPTVTELTLEQIADKFGVDVKTLKIKK